MPVWSLASSTTSALPRGDVDDDGALEHNGLLPASSMNIVSFCSSVSVAAPKLWIVSLYHNTLTKDSFLASGEGVLQLLRPAQKVLVPVLGKRSGYESGYSKRSECASLGFEWVPWSTSYDDGADAEYRVLELLPDCASYMHLKVLDTIPAGDHVVALCEVIRTSQWDEESRRIKPAAVDASSSALDATTVLYTGQLRQEGII